MKNPLLPHPWLVYLGGIKLFKFYFEEKEQYVAFFDEIVNLDIHFYAQPMIQFCL